MNNIQISSYGGYKLVHTSSLHEIEMPVTHEQFNKKVEIGILLSSSASSEQLAWAEEVVQKCIDFIQNGGWITFGHTITVSNSFDFFKDFIFLEPKENHLTSEWSKLSNYPLVIMIPLKDGELDSLNHTGFKKFFKAFAKAGNTSLVNFNRKAIKPKRLLGLF